MWESCVYFSLPKENYFGSWLGFSRSKEQEMKDKNQRSSESKKDFLRFIISMSQRCSAHWQVFLLTLAVPHLVKAEKPRANGTLL